MPGRIDAKPLSRLIAEQLDRTFADSGLTQGQLGARAGVSQSQISKYLRGVRVPDIDVLDAICRALDLDLVTVVAEARQRRS